MRGEPIAQARKAIDACLGALSETDSFGLVAFGSDVSTFQPALVFGTRDLREKAHDFLMREHPCGGTDLTRGLLEAAKLFAGGGGDILILTDGQVGGTEAILADAREAGVRLHCMGIGSASQDRFLTLLARETRGVSRFVTPRERVDVPAVDLFASMGRPVASGLKAEGNIQPQPPSSVFSGSPVLLFGECAGEAGADRIEMSWTGGSLTLPIDVSESDMAQTLWLLQGSRLITDWESRYPSEHAMAPLEKRKQNRVAMRLLELSQTYGLASREMSLVAVVTRPGDRPGELPQTRIVPVGMAQDTLFGAFFGMSFLSDVMSRRPSGAMKQTASGSISPGFLRSEMKSMPETSLIRRLFASRNAAVLPADNIRRPNTPDDILIDIASRLESDGGMPGKNLEARAIATVIALLAFLSQGHTLTSGAFRSHVGRLAAFLETVKSLSSERQKIAAAVIQLTRKGRAPAGEWITLASTPGDHWNAVEQGLFAINADGRLVQDRA